MKNYTVFEELKTNSAGVWFFVPDSGVFKKGTPCKGFGAIKYAEGSVYTGDIFYDGKNFNKKGYGQQDFTKSSIGDTVKTIGEKKYKFVGCYDYRKTDWIYGNGVLYYTYEDGKPSHFRKGFFKGLDKIGEYKGEFDYGSLLDSYTPDMEFDFDENENRLEERWKLIQNTVNNAGKPRVLFIGDSYFELSDVAEFAGKNLFNCHFPKDYVNIGICGTRFIDWLGWADKIKNFPAPDKIVLNLGFNDLHNGRSAKQTFSDFKKFTGILHEFFPRTKLYSVNVIHSPNSANHFEKESEYNKMIEKNAAKYGVTVGDWNNLIGECGKNCFHADAIHPNETGYGLFAEFIKNLVST